VTPNSGYQIWNVTGCNGSLSGNTYTTGTITAACTVTASFSQFTYTSTTITDNLTGLVWQRGTAGKYAWSSAKATCLSLGTGWRLPTIDELKSLICAAGHLEWIKNGCDGSNADNPAGIAPYTWLDSLVFTTNASGYWSSTAHATNTIYAWYVDFKYGGVYTNNKSDPLDVRCVRSGP
jgi:uncharacterized protein (TIGR02145 family)